MPITFLSNKGAAASTVVLKLSKDLQQNEQDMRYAADRQRDRMVRRTGKGVDADGQPFRPYSNKYAERKAKSGRDSGKVDLTWSGRMLKAMRTSRVTDRSFVIGIYGDEGVRAAVHNYGMGKAPVRKFMGANQQDRVSILKDVVSRRMARANDTGLNVPIAA
jgi:phage gpG-like protein